MPITTLQRSLTLNSLGFKEEPFSTSADTRFLYLSSQHGDILNRTQNIVDQRKGLSGIRGDYGIGKSTVARRLDQLYRTAPDDYFVLYVASASYESEWAALDDFCGAFGLTPRRGLTGTWRLLEEKLNQIHASGRNIVMLLDDAQLMAPSALTALQHLYNYDVQGKIVQVILFGQPEIKDIFKKRPEVESRVFQWFDLNPLTHPEAYSLIQFRGNVAGRSEHFLSRQQFLDVFEVTGGVPRFLVNMCSLIVDQVMLLGKNAVDDQVVRDAINEFRARSQPAIPTQQPPLFSEEQREATAHLPEPLPRRRSRAAVPSTNGGNTEAES
jgi:general secretion pathway protein A